MAFEFHAEHMLTEWPEYWSTLHEYRDEHGQQMLTLHIIVHSPRFSAGVYKRIISEFNALRASTDAPIFAIEDTPDDKKWERFVTPMGFEFSSRVHCTDGQSRRCFVSKKNNKNESLQQQQDAGHFVQQPAVVSTAAVPPIGLLSGV